METPALSVVVPVYNEADCLPAFHAELSAVLKDLRLTHELIFVDDGSTDRSLEVIAGLQASDPAVAAVVLSRNFGHQTALTAGLELARGQAVVTLDSDLQHPPKLIGRLVEEWRKGALVVHTVREETEDSSALKDLTSALFYGLINRLSATPIRPGAADFRLLDRKAVDALNSMKERHRFLRGMIGWLGFPEAVVPFKAGARAAGRSKYTWRKMFRLAADAVVSFSTKPLRAALWLGLAALGVNAVYAVYVLYMFFFHDGVIKGWASIVLLAMFLGSAQLTLVGIVGEYVGRIYDEVKSRPLYLVRELRPHRLGSPASR